LSSDVDCVLCQGGASRHDNKLKSTISVSKKAATSADTPTAGMSIYLARIHDD